MAATPIDDAFLAHRRDALITCDLLEPATPIDDAFLAHRRDALITCDLLEPAGKRGLLRMLHRLNEK